MTLSKQILPGATLGMLGGGQLGRMFTTAAQTMGYRVVVLDPDTNSPAGIIADQHICAKYTDEKALNQLAELCDAITTEFENIPATTLSYLETKTTVHPSSKALAQTQNRIIEKQFIESLGINVAPYAAIRSAADIDAIANTFHFPAILKAASFGYDGKGQVVCSNASDVHSAFAALNNVECVLEQRINLEREVSTVLARGQSGDITNFPVAENVHVNGVLHSTTVPSSIPEQQAQSILKIADTIAEGLDYVGTMAVEFFISTEGDILANEIAPRPHNSGHFTLDACETSQFEQQVRMLCGLPSGNCKLTSPVVMINLLGDVWGKTQPHWDSLLSQPQIKLHLYGKKEARAGRKMGHFNVLTSDIKQATKIALQSFEDLKAD
ncbi:MAG: 5-(carboxyamino)imidazole ribonucleotide synthase [Piscirickettsiaceae bacterium]|nr:5-(carboxyamino)imidazole ribonucleotide synthase [Piscirickettsiaceae bacterium]